MGKMFYVYKEALKEALEYLKGNIKLRSKTITVNLKNKITLIEEKNKNRLKDEKRKNRRNSQFSSRK